MASDHDDRAAANAKRNDRALALCSFDLNGRRASQGHVVGGHHRRVAASDRADKEKGKEQEEEEEEEARGREEGRRDRPSERIDNKHRRVETAAAAAGGTSSEQWRDEGNDGALFLYREGIHVKAPDRVASSFCVMCLTEMIPPHHTDMESLARALVVADFKGASRARVASYSDMTTLGNDRVETVMSIDLVGKATSPVFVARAVARQMQRILLRPEDSSVAHFFSVLCAPIVFREEAAALSNGILWVQSWLNNRLFPRTGSAAVVTADVVSNDIRSTWNRVPLGPMMDRKMLVERRAEEASTASTAPTLDRLSAVRALTGVLRCSIDPRSSASSSASCSSTFAFSKHCALVEGDVARAFFRDYTMTTAGYVVPRDTSVMAVVPPVSAPPPTNSSGGIPHRAEVTGGDENMFRSSKDRNERAVLDPVAAALENVARHADPCAHAKVKSMATECGRQMLPCSASAKVKKWLEYVARLPLGIDSARSPPPPPSSMAASLATARRTLDEVCNGMQAAKTATLEVAAKLLVAPHAPVRAMMMEGPPGCGKTTFLTRGLGKALGRPVRVIHLGGARDTSFLLGHGYTYEGSRPGRIVEELVAAGTMDPVIVLDEVDKISDTPSGREVVHVLMSLVDPAQNGAFMDTYLTGVPLDLSRAFVVFTCNDASLVDPVLLDRIRLVRLGEPSRAERVDTARDFIIPRIARAMGWSYPPALLPDDASDRGDIVKRIVDACCSEPAGGGGGGGGMRSIEKLVERVIMKAMIRRIETQSSSSSSSSFVPGSFVEASDVRATLVEIQREDEQARQSARYALDAQVHCSMYT